MSNWELISYDVWGNIDSGYEVNDIYNTGRVVEIINDEDDNQVLDALKALDVVHADVTVDELELDGDEEVIYVNDAGSSYPMCELRLTEAESTGVLLS